jgi:hypothetical protein
MEQRSKEMDVSIRLPETQGGSLPAAPGQPGCFLPLRAGK